MSAFRRRFTPILLAVPLLAAAPLPSQPEAGTNIVATVNGDVVSRGDVEERARLFALSAGLAPSHEVIERLSPQVTRALVDEKLRLQEMQKRKVVVADADIANAIRSVEQRNNMPAGMLRQRLAAAGIDMRTMIDQVRVQIGWTRVLRDQLGSLTDPTPTEIADQQRLLKDQTGQPEYRVGEIFLPVPNPAQDSEVKSFAETIIQQLRSGAPFTVVAAQFSQAQTALEGGDLGWVQPLQLDPEVARVVTQMPDGAIANPIHVPGGYIIATVHGKRVIGSDPATMLTVREAFLPFSSTLNPQAPTEQQKQMLERAKQMGSTVHSCDEMEAANKAAGSVHPTDPGEVRLEGVNPPAFRALLATLPEGKPSQPLVSSDGITVVIVCKRETKNLGVVSKEDIVNQLVGERAELASRQLLRDLQRRASIELRPGNS
jgi:peptidyl-prolyl cis-trans isomerase SurA